MENAANKRVTDPVCGMRVDPSVPGPLTCAYKGRTYYFCAASCREAFEKDPARYLKQKGFLKRWLARMARSNEEVFGSKGCGCCH